MAGKQSREGMVTYKCTNCYSEMSVTKRREKNLDGRRCFYCDSGPIAKVENKKESLGKFTVDMDCSDALKGLKAVQREAKKATAALKEFESQKQKDKLLVIELVDEESVPRVFYEGKEVTEKVRINFDWRTKTDKPGKLLVNVEHYELDDKGLPNLTGIGIDRLIGGDHS